MVNWWWEIIAASPQMLTRLGKSFRNPVPIAHHPTLSRPCVKMLFESLGKRLPNLNPHVTNVPPFRKI
jgi:hypothetical protein